VRLLYQVENWERYNPRNDYKGLPWFRCQSDLLYEDKLFGLGPDQKFLWPCVLGLAAKQNKRGLVELDVAYLAHFSGVTPDRVQAAIDHFVVKGLLTIGARPEDAIKPTVTWPDPGREPIAPRTDDVHDPTGPRTDDDRDTYVPCTDDEREPIAPRSDDDQITFATERNGTERNAYPKPRSRGAGSRRGPDHVSRAQADSAALELIGLGRIPMDAPDPPLSALAREIAEHEYGLVKRLRQRFERAVRENQLIAFERDLHRLARRYARMKNSGAFAPKTGGKRT
jgi:hypothetical protein